MHQSGGLRDFAAGDRVVPKKFQTGREGNVEVTCTDQCLGTRSTCASDQKMAATRTKPQETKNPTQKNKSNIMSAHALVTPRAPPSCRRSILSAHASHSCLRGHLRHVAVSARWRAQTDARSSDHLVITIIILSGICFPPKRSFIAWFTNLHINSAYIQSQ